MASLDRLAILDAMGICAGGVLGSAVHGGAVVDVSERSALEEIRQEDRHQQTQIDREEHMEVPAHNGSTVLESVEEEDDRRFDDG